MASLRFYKTAVPAGGFGSFLRRCTQARLGSLRFCAGVYSVRSLHSFKREREGGNVDPLRYQQRAHSFKAEAAYDGFVPSRVAVSKRARQFTAGSGLPRSAQRPLYGSPCFVLA